MSVFSRLFRKNRIRDETEENSNTALSLVDVFGEGYRTGTVVGTSNSLLLSPVAAAHRILTNSLGGLPVGLYVKKDGRREAVTSHRTLEVLQKRSNLVMSPFMLKKTLMSDCFWYGEAFARPIYSAGGTQLEEMRYYPHSSVSRVEVETKRGKEIWYRLTEANGEAKTWAPDEIIKLLFDSSDGEKGYGILDLAKQTIRTDLGAQTYSEKFYSNGARPSGILKTDGKLETDAKYKARNTFMAMVGGSENAYRVAVLDRGLEYTPLGISQSDAQFMESRNFTVEEISRFTGIPLYKLQAGKQSYQSNEQQGIDYVVNTLRPIVTQWEQELTYKLLNRRERDAGMYYRFNLEAEMRGDSKSRAEFYRSMIEHGVYRVDECRALEELPPLPNGMGQIPLITKNLDSLEHVLSGESNQKGGK